MLVKWEQARGEVYEELRGQGGSPSSYYMKGLHKINFEAEIFDNIGLE